MANGARDGRTEHAEVGGEPVTRQAFDRHMTRLIGLKFPPDSLDTHWDVLAHIDEGILKAAVAEAQGLYDEFPSPRQLLACVASAERRAARLGPQEDRSTPLPEPIYYDVPNYGRIRINREWKYHCEDCSDSGWRNFACGEGLRVDVPMVACARDVEHPPHQWVTPCSCAESNPEVKRRRDKQAAMAAQRVGRPSRGEAA